MSLPENDPKHADIASIRSERRETRAPSGSRGGDCENQPVVAGVQLHKVQLASDRTSCRAATANQMRLVLHTAAYWLILAVRDAIPKTHALAKAEFNTIRLRLLKVAARVIETASRVRIAFASACPDAVLFRHLAVSISPGAP